MSADGASTCIGGLAYERMIIAELTLPCEPDVAWRHLREPELIRRWFGWDYEGLGHEIDVIFMQEVSVDDRAHVLQTSATGSSPATASS